jgi:plastocyanin
MNRTGGRPWFRIALLLIAVVLIFLVVSAVIGVIIGRRGEDRSDDPPVVISAMEVTIDIRDFNFDPGHISVPAGAEVTWVNHDPAPHDATSDENTWSTISLDETESQSLIFDDAGTYAYRCSIHPDMKARLTVRP